MATPLLLLCLFFALAASYRLAARLSPVSLLHRLSLTGLLFSANLILPATYLGVINQLNAAALVIGGIVLWTAEIVFAGRIPTLTEPAFVGAPPQPVWYRIIYTALVATIIVLFTLMMGILLLLAPEFVDWDSAWHYLPNLFNFVQAGTLNIFTGFVPYFPSSYELLLSWELTLTQRATLLGAMHGLVFIVGIAYVVLIAHLLLRHVRSTYRDIVVIGILFLLLASTSSFYILAAVGKNDVYLLSSGVAALYYLLRYWDVKREPVTLVLVGLAGGLYLSTKLSGLAWLAALGVIHLLLVFALIWREHRPWTVIMDQWMLVVPGLIVLAPWALRVLLNPGAFAAQGEFARLASQNTILSRFTYPTLLENTLRFAPPVLFLIGLGLGILIWYSLRQRSSYIWPALGAASIVCGILLFPSETRNPMDFTLYLLTLALSAGVILAWRFMRRAVSDGLAIMMAVIGLSAIVLAFVPFSVYFETRPWQNDAVFLVVNYRYSPPTFTLLLCGLIVLALRLIAPLNAETTQIKPASRAQMPVIPILLGALLMLMFARQIYFGSTRGFSEQFVNFADDFIRPTHFYSWFDRNIRDSTIYAINVPPLPLYGDPLTNRVVYVTPGYDGYFGSQAYRWQDVSQLVADYQVDYVVVSYSYSEMPQARLLPTRAVQAEIAQLYTHYELIYHDDHIRLFATPLADTTRVPRRFVDVRGISP